MRQATLALGVLLLLLVFYVLSYAPMARYCLTEAVHRTGIGVTATGTTVRCDSIVYVQQNDNPVSRAYRPVHWLVEWTPLREPLLLWSDLWDIRAAMEDPQYR